MSAFNLLGIELLVQNIDAATELFEGALGFELVERRSSEDPAGELAVFAIGDAAVTVIQPRDHGPGTVIEDRRPRLGQIVLGAARGQSADVIDAVSRAGGSVLRLDDQRTLIAPLVMAGATGIDAAITVVETSDSGG